jgi:hypothetical protein
MMHPSRVMAGTSAAADDLDRSVALMAKIGASWSPRFSPDGMRMVFVSNLNGSRKSGPCLRQGLSKISNGV